MKRMLLLLVISVVLSLSIAFADMGAPEVKPYKAYISNFEGAQYLDYQTQEYKTIDYGTSIYVVYEDYYSDDNIVYVTAQIGENEENYNAPYVRIKLSDIGISGNAKVIPENFSTMVGKKAIFKSKGSGAEMKEGPAEIYNSSGVLVPDGAEVTAYDYSDYSAWNYVEYNGTRGWIKLINGACWFYPEYQELIVLENVRMSSENSDENSNPTIIPADTKITDYLRNNQRYLVNYKGEDGILFSEQLVVEEKGTIEVNEDSFNVYRSLDISQDSVTEEWAMPTIAKNVPKGTKLTYEYRNPDQPLYYVEYNGEHGWAYAYGSKVTVEQNAKLKDSSSSFPKQESSIPTQTEEKDVSTVSTTNKVPQISWMLIIMGAVVILTVIVVVIFVGRND